MQLKPGDRVYGNNHNKSVIFAVVGSESLNEGTHICAAHIDSPRLDLKPNPLYEDAGMAYFKTHYYGGIKKYQWTPTPLAIHGVVCKERRHRRHRRPSARSRAIPMLLRDRPAGPPGMLSRCARRLAEGIDGREPATSSLGSRPLEVDGRGRPKDAEMKLVKALVLMLLHEKYGLDGGGLPLRRADHRPRRPCA